jgi:putative tricarboxylic transport membrane protein
LGWREADALKLADAALGVVLLGAAAAIAVAAREFPVVPGQAFGPSLFPGVIAAGFALCGVALILRHWRRRPGGPWLDPGPLLAEPRARLDALLLFGAIGFYLAAAERLGFMPTAALILLVLVRRFGASWWLAIATAALGPLAIHLLFAEWLRVPLPLGLMLHLRY